MKRIAREEEIKVTLDSGTRVYGSPLLEVGCSSQSRQGVMCVQILQTHKECPREAENRHPHQKKKRTPLWKRHSPLSGTWYPEQRSSLGIFKKGFENL